MGDQDTSVQVALRIRPQSAGEMIDMCRVCTSVTPGEPQVILGKDKAFTYDYVYDTESEQHTIFDQVSKGLVDGCFDGFNATLLAYGQTGSGKTYTMGTGFGTNLSEYEVGIIPRAVGHLFATINRLTAEANEDGTPAPDFKVMAQFMELYNEDIIDLLDIESKGRKQIKIHEDSNGVIYTTGICMKQVYSAEDCLKTLELGALSRTTASTNMNATSSRSHAIFTLHVNHNRVVKVESSDQTDGDSAKPPAEEFECLSAKFNFVDLAGSERLKRTGATGDRAKEGISINQGLLSLGNVISALGDRAKRGCHVPYRDSKLTRLLQDSLGGNSRTIMIACVSPSDRDFMETLNTLKYANRARNIKNKVVANQDKASKQIAALRAEIQQLSLELLEYKQGKRVTDGSGEHMTDAFHENTMLRTENENLRMRIKALQNTIDAQTRSITENKTTAALAVIAGGDKEGNMEDIIKTYIKEIEDLRNKLVESEAMSSAAVKRAHNISRMAVTPGSPEDEGISILELAKKEIKKEKKLIKKVSHHSPSKMPSPIKEAWEENEESEKDGKKHRSNSIMSHTEDDKENENRLNDDGEEDDNVGSSDEQDEDEDEELDEDDNDDDDDDDDDDDSSSEGSTKSELEENLVGLSNEITMKQKLIEELEHSQTRLAALKHQYEDKLQVMQNKIRETETERDKVLKNIGSVDAKAEEKARDVRKTYEKKISVMQKELTKLQAAKREHARLLKSQEQHEKQLRTLRGDLSDLKKAKVRLVRQMRDEMNKAKVQEGKYSRQLEQMIKENRKRDIEIKRMKEGQKQKDLILKRKQEELTAMRKHAKPISGQMGQQQPLQQRLIKQQSLIDTMNRKNKEDHQSYSLPKPKEIVRRRGDTSVSTTSNSSKQLTPKRKSPAVSKAAKQKWNALEKKMSELVVKMRRVADMENDMERWLQEREKISKQLDYVKKKREEAIRLKRDENTIQDLNERFEGLTAHLDYIQENISDSQNTIMDMEEIGEKINTSELIAGCSISEARYMLEHFYNKTIEQLQELANKEAAYKVLNCRVEVMEQHFEVQQQLLQHVYSEQHCAEASIDEPFVPQSDAIATLEEAESDQLNQSEELPQKDRKARRRTALPEELLGTMPTRSLSKKFSLDAPSITSSSESELSKINRSRPKSEKQSSEISKSLMDRLMQLDQETQKKDVDKLMMPPPPGLPGANASIRSSSFSTSHSMSDLSAVASDSAIQRGTKITRSARSFATNKGHKLYGSSGNLGSRSQPSSANPSPLIPRKNSTDPSDKTKNAAQTETDQDVFTRLTSGLPQEADPDIGQMLPVKAPAGRPDSLVCTYSATGHNNAVLSLTVDEERLITGSKDRTAKIWDLKTGDEIVSLGGHKRDVSVVRYSPVSRLVFTVNLSTIKIWDVRQNTGTCVKTLSGSFFMRTDSHIMDLGLNSPCTVLYSAVGNSVKMIDLRTYSTLGKLTGHQGAITCLKLVEDQGHSDIVITGSKDHFVKVYEVVTETADGQDFGNNIQQRMEKMKDKICKTVKPRHNLEPPHYDGVQSLAVKDSMLFSGSRDNSIKKWDFQKHELQDHINAAHKDWVCALDFVPNQNVLLSGCRSGVLGLWETNSCKKLGEINAHGRSINAIASNSTGIFTASSDRLVRIWKPTSTLQEQVAQLTSEN